MLDGAFVAEGLAVPGGRVRVAVLPALGLLEERPLARSVGLDVEVEVDPPVRLDVGEELEVGSLVDVPVGESVGLAVEVDVGVGAGVLAGAGAGEPPLPSARWLMVLPRAVPPVTAADSGLSASASVAVMRTTAIAKTITAGPAMYFHGSRLSRWPRDSWTGATLRTRVDAAVIDFPYSAEAVVETTEARAAPISVPATPR